MRVSSIYRKIVKEGILRASLAISAHSHDDNAGLCDDVPGELVEGGVGVIVEALQLLDHIVQLEVNPERLREGFVAGVHYRGVKLEDRVVLAQSLLHKLDK